MKDYNADQRAEQRESANVTIGSKVFHPVRLSNANVRKLRTAVRESAKEAEDAQDEARKAAAALTAGELSVEQQRELENAQDTALIAAEDLVFKSLIAQLQVLLIDEAGKAPTIAHLEKSLDLAVARDMIGALMGGDDGGNSSTPSTTPTEAISI